MQQVNRVFKVPLPTVFEDSNGFHWTEWQPWTTDETKVSSSPIVKGNFKDANPWSYSVDKLYLHPCSENVYYSEGSYWSKTSQSLTERLTAPLCWDDATANSSDKIVEKLYKKVRGDLDLSIDILQARQTARMFSVSSQLDTFFGSRYRGLRKAGSAWLQYVYGWKPLASSIYGVVEESRRVVCRKIDDITVRVREPFEAVTPVTSGRANSHVVNVASKGVVIRKIRARYELPSSDLARWTSLNPVSIAWELLPYSFVVDWVIDVGTFLRSMESAVLYSSQFRGGYSSTLKVQDDSWADDLTVESATRNKYHQWAGQRARREFSRVILEATPIPRPPRLNLELGSSRLLSAAALLSQRLR